jgi:hypothetical protein
MSRVSRYHDSFKAFINKRSCLSDVQGSDVYESIQSHLKDNQYILPILMLTITNNQNKKNKVSFLGYYAASGIEFLRIFLELSNYRDYYIHEYGIDKYCRITNLLIMWCMKSWHQNMDAVKRHLSDDKINKLYSTFTTLLNNKMGIDGLLDANPIDKNDVTRSDLHKYYSHRNETELLNLFKEIKHIKKDDMDKMINNKMGSLSEFVVLIGWILGCGNESQSSRLIRAGKSFGIMYQIAQDFENIDRDVHRSKYGTVYNYVINCGIQESYEKFMENKHKFIEEALNLDVFSSTVKEIVDIIEGKVDLVIDETSPDLKSTYSTIC